jgi:hypothetical protein
LFSQLYGISRGTNASYHHGLIDKNTPQSQIKRITQEYSIAPVVGAVYVVIAYFSPIAGIVTNFLVSVYFGITVTGGEQYTLQPEENRQTICAWNLH